MTLTTSSVLAITSALVAVAAAACLLVRHVRLRHTLRLERRYWARWERLGEGEKRQVLRRMGVVLWTPDVEDPSLTDARLDDLFRAVLAAGGKDLGLSPLASSSLALALLDVEVDWAFSPAARSSRLL